MALKIKKANNIQTYKEIVAFYNGETLSKTDKIREEAKRPYQKVIMTLAAAVICAVVGGMVAYFIF